MTIYIAEWRNQKYNNKKTNKKKKNKNTEFEKLKSARNMDVKKIEAFHCALKALAMFLICSTLEQSIKCIKDHQ